MGQVSLSSLRAAPIENGYSSYHSCLIPFLSLLTSLSVDEWASGETESSSVSLCSIRKIKLHLAFTVTLCRRVTA